MFKSILVPTDGSLFCEIALKYALDLAKRYKAYIKALHVVDIRAIKGLFIKDISASMGLVPIVDYQPKIQQILEERGRLTLDASEANCKAAGIRFYRELVTGIISQEIKSVGHTVDMIVMGQRGEHAEFGTVLLGSTLEATIRITNKPVLVTPKEYTPISRILMAYDGGDVANDALRVCRNICMELALPATVITASDHKENADAILEEARQYLSPNDLEVEYVLRTGEASKIILAAMDDYKCDLLIMGAYGRNRFIELVLGSTTSYLLRKATFPVLLSR